MRIIAGEFRGRRLAPVRGRMRPTSDQVREAMFNILGPLVEGAKVLDLFAGTGALACEALSRGAALAVLVEDQPAALEVVRRNIETLGLRERARVLPLPVQGALKQLATRGERFDLIFLDPPYGRSLAEATLTVLAGSGLAAPGGWVVAEHSHRESLPERLEGLALLQNRRYGDTRVAFYLAGEKSPAEEQRG